MQCMRRVCSWASAQDYPHLSISAYQAVTESFLTPSLTPLTVSQHQLGNYGPVI